MKLYEGTIITCDDKNTIAGFLVEDGGRIVYVGNDLPAKYRNMKRKNLGKKALIPSFADSHIHFANFSLFHAGLNVMNARSNRHILEMLKEFVKGNAEEIIIAYGASPHAVEEKQLITKKELDLVCEHKPVIVVKYDGHTCIINSTLMKQIKNKVSGLRGFHEDSGEMEQEAFIALANYVTNTVSPLKLIRHMKKAIDYLASKGVGLIQSVSGTGFPKDLDVDLERWFGLGLNNGFQMRVSFQTLDVEKAVNRKLERIGGCFATALDGCFGTHDAALIQPYEGTSYKGNLYYSDEKVIEFCKKANRANLQIELHAIGDAAFNQAARALKAALEDYKRVDHRHGIIHACLPTKEGLEICKDFSIQILLQSSFIHLPQEPYKHHSTLLGKRSLQLHPLHTIQSYGIKMSCGSDAPCTDPDPIRWIHNACNHSISEESVSVYEALRMCTYNGYAASFDEKERGSLEVGKIADMVILTENPYAIPKERLKDMRVKRLYLGGKHYKSVSQGNISLILKGMFSSKKI